MKRMFITVAVIAALSTAAVYASGISGSYKGFPIANVTLNGAKVASDVPGIILDSRTLLPVRAIAEAMGSVIQWDQKTMTAKIIRPTINLIFAGDITEDPKGHLTLADAGSYYNTTGTNRWENFYVEIGPMEEKTYEYRISAFDPKDNLIGSSEIQSEIIGKEGLIAYLPVENLTYSISGNYKFKFQIKYDGKFETVGETIAVIQ